MSSVQLPMHIEIIDADAITTVNTFHMSSAHTTAIHSRVTTDVCTVTGTSVAI
jgi:hypothetical protein